MKCKNMIPAALLICTLFLSACTQTEEISAPVSQSSSDHSSAEESSALPAEKHYISISAFESYDIPDTDLSDKFSSSDPDVASVNSSGTITGVSEGKAEINVKKDGVLTDVFIVTVSRNVYEKTMPSEPEGSDSSENRITPAVWEVTAGNGNTVYMMGSIHIGDVDALYLPDYFYAAFANCSALAVECDTQAIDLPSTVSYLNNYLYTDGTRIYDHVSEEAYTNSKNALKEYGMYNSQSDLYKPMLWVQQLELSAGEKVGLYSDYAVDTTVMSEAAKKGKQLLELESVEFQMELLTGIDDETQELMLENYADPDYFDTSAESTENTYNKWKAGTLTAEDVGAEVDYSQFYSSDMTAGERVEADKNVELLKKYNTKLLDDRNAGMEDKISDFLDEGKAVMVVVGAGHFYGDKGIISLLEKDGYTVRSVTSEDVTRLRAKSA